MIYLLDYLDAKMESSNNKPFNLSPRTKCFTTFNDWIVRQQYLGKVIHVLYGNEDFFDVIPANDLEIKVEFFESE